MFKNRKLIGRLKTAWDYCTQDLNGEAQRLSKPGAVDDEDFIDAPWPEVRKENCHSEVRRLYGGLTLEPDLTLSDVIMNRLDRSLKNGKAL